MKIKVKVLSVLALMISISANSAVTCSGKILEIVKWSGSEDISILLENTGRYIKFNDKTAVSMALTAFSAKKNVTVHLSDATITSCIEGWPHYTIHQGYFSVKN